jgi:hypothetical protein
MGGWRLTLLRFPRSRAYSSRTSCSRGVRVSFVGKEDEVEGSWVVGGVSIVG